ncbi:hypothetical protein OAH18_03025 [bacterium]|nr:hypothetical protein [bacterium]
MKPSQSKDHESRANPLKGKVQQYDAKGKQPREKTVKLLPRKKYALLDKKEHTDVMPCVSRRSRWRH